VLTLNIAAKSWPANNWKRTLRRLSVSALLPLLVCAGCSNAIPTVPRIPPPAQDLMRPVPTGSEYLESVSPELKALDDDLARWERMLQNSLTP